VIRLKKEAKLAKPAELESLAQSIKSRVKSFSKKGENFAEGAEARVKAFVRKVQ